MTPVYRGVVAAACASLVIGFAARPVEAQGGAVIVRIPDGADSRCISTNDDRIWLTLRRAIVDKKGGWLKENVAVSFLVTAQMRVASGRPVSFPLMAEANVQGYSNGQVSIPVEFTFIDALALKQKTTTYSGATIDMTIFNQQARTAWGSALTALFEVAKKLPLPTGPVTDAVSYLMDFGISALNKDTAKVDSKDKAKSATISMNFHPNGNCGAGGFEKTGTLAVLQDPPSPTPPGAIRVSDVDNYCWSAELSPAFVLKAAKRDATVACTDAAHYKNAFQQVANNYVGLVLNAVKNPDTLASSTAKQNDIRAAQRRCQVNGIPAAQCAR